MPRHIAMTSAAAMLIPTLSVAEVPSVATDIAPVHSLVKQVMGDLGTPKLIVPPGASPHGYAMRPSEARALSEADLVVWVGEDLSPWLSDPIGTLAPGAEVLELLELPGTVTHDFREDVIFAPNDPHEGAEQEASASHDHDDHEEHEDHDDHEEHEDHEGHDDHDTHDEHEPSEHADGSDHAHDHDGADPHAWLDPENGRVWLQAIADALSAADPENAETYAANAATAQERLTALEAEVGAQFHGASDVRFLVLHDSYQYFETRFGLQALGAISMSDATDPSAGRLATLRDAILSEGVDCVITQPQFDSSLIEAIVQGGVANTVILDPIGVDLEPGADLYNNLLRAMADGLAGCR